MHPTFFQYCPKMVIFSSDKTEILLGKRIGEKDYNNVFSFFGGKMENTDKNILDSISREKNEELGVHCYIQLHPNYSTNYFFKKNDGNHMIIPHFYAEFISGEINLSNEYSEYIWLPVRRIESFEPMIHTIPEVIHQLLKLSTIIDTNDMVQI